MAKKQATRIHISWINDEFACCGHMKWVSFVFKFFRCFPTFLHKQLAWNQRENTVRKPWKFIIGRERLFLGVKEKPLKNPKKCDIFHTNQIEPLDMPFLVYNVISCHTCMHASWTTRNESTCAYIIIFMHDDNACIVFCMQDLWVKRYLVWSVSWLTLTEFSRLLKGQPNGLQGLQKWTQSRKVFELICPKVTTMKRQGPKLRKLFCHCLITPDIRCLH